MKKKITGLLLSTLMLAHNIYANLDSEDICCDTPCCGLGTFEVGGEWLYWRADQDSMNYASHNTSAVDPAEPTIFDSKRSSVRPKFAAKSGYRVFASYETCDTNWKVGVTYTHAPSKASSSANSPTPLTGSDFIQVLPINFALLNPLVLTSFSETQARWNLKINYIDIDLQRNFSVCQNLEIAPHVGFRSLWIDQSFHWSGVDSNGLAPSGAAKLKFDGYGVEGGLLGAWNVGFGFSIIGNIGGSLLYSRVHSHGVLNYSVGDFQVIDRYSDIVHRATPTFDSFLGIQYKTSVCDYTFAARVGWENHVFFNVSQFSLSKAENLSMQGLTLGGSVGF